MSSSNTLTPVREVLDALVAGLQSIPELTAQLGGPEYISAYDPEDGEFRSAAEAVRSMSEGSMLVIFEGLGQGLRGEIPAFVYQFSIAIMAPGEFAGEGGGSGHPGYFDLARTVLGGIIPATDLRWLDSPVHNNFDPPDNPQLLRGTVDGTDVWQLNFSLTEIGG